MSYTKGKWKLRNVGTGRVKVESCNIAHSVQIASVDNVGIETQLSNARLIAAAPELLEACEYYEEALAYIFKKIDFGKSSLDAKAIQYMNEMGLKGTAAIARAKAAEKP